MLTGNNVQLCDAPLVPKIPDYLEEATYERMTPGAGELPLLDILAALPPGLVINVETPLRSQADRGIGPHARLAPVVEAARNLIGRLDRRAEVR